MRSTQSIPPGALWLGYAGVLPFAGLALAAAMVPAPVPGQISSTFLLYSGLILSFLGGVRWGAAAAAGAGPGAYVLAVSPSLWAFACLLWPGSAGQLAGMLAGFLLLGLLDVMRPPTGQPAWMRSLRLRLTLAVVICHAIVLAAV